MSKNYYDILEVSKTSTQDEIKKSYRRLSKLYHPDKAGAEDKEAEEKFKEIGEAYEVLSNEEKRRNYDTYGDPKGPKYNEESFSDLRNQYRDAFSTFGHGRGIVRGSSIPYFLLLTLEEIKNGAKKRIKYKKNIVCNSCYGNGSKFGKSIVNCSLCSGSGMSYQQLGPMRIERTCHHCGGNGKFITEACDSCQTSGMVTKDMEMEIDMPAGVADGWKSRIVGYGNDALTENVGGGIPGDLIIIVQEAKHKLFERQEDDIIYKLDLTFPNIILGTKVEVPTLDTPVSFNIPPNTSLGKIFRLKGRGIPSFVNKEFIGDLLVVVGATVPEQITDEEKEILEKLRKSDNFISK